MLWFRRFFQQVSEDGSLLNSNTHPATTAIATPLSVAESAPQFQTSN